MVSFEQKKKKNEKDDVKIAKKEWKKPVVITIRAEELKKYIQAAAYSGGVCAYGTFGR